MFLLFEINKCKSHPIEMYDEDGGRYTMYCIYSRFSLFTIPLFKFLKVYLLEYGQRGWPLSRKEYHQMKASGKVLPRYAAKAAEVKASDEARSAQPEEGATYSNEYCPVCKSKLEESFAFCPFCGQKQPKNG